jgi:hypothetical protein
MKPTGSPGSDQPSGAEGVPLPRAMTPAPELKARVMTAAAEQPAPPRRAVLREAAALTVGSLLAALTVFFYAGGPRVTARPIALVVGTAMGTAIIAAIALWAALGRGRSMLARTRRLLLPIAVGSPSMILAWKMLWSAQYSGALDEWSTRPGFRCLALSLSIGLCPLIAFALARRGSDPVRPALTGFAAGVAIGCATVLLTDLWCPVAYLPHLLLGHVLPIVILGALGAWLGRQVVALKSQ